MCVHATFEFNIGIDSYVFFHWHLLYFRDFGTNLKQPQINKTIVIIVTVGQRNGIREILKLKSSYIYCCFCVCLSFVEKTIDIPLVLMLYFDVQAVSLGTGVKVQEKVIPDSFPCNLFLRIFSPDSFYAIGVVKTMVPSS